MKYKLVLNDDGPSAWVDSRAAPKTIIRKVDDGIHVSDMAMGCLPQEVDKFRADAKANGFHVEFKGEKRSRDPDGTDNYMAAHIPKGELERYRKHRRLYDKNSKNGSGAMLTEDSLAIAEGLVQRKYGLPRVAAPTS